MLQLNFILASSIVCIAVRHFHVNNRACTFSVVFSSWLISMLLKAGASNCDLSCLWLTIEIARIERLRIHGVSLSTCTWPNSSWRIMRPTSLTLWTQPIFCEQRRSCKCSVLISWFFIPRNFLAVFIFATSKLLDCFFVSAEDDPLVFYFSVSSLV